MAGYACIKTGKRNKSVALESSGKHLQIDTWSTMAVIGGLLIIRYTGQFWIDKFIALVLSGVVLYNGYRIIRASLAGIMDEADQQLLTQMVRLLNASRRENWVDIHNLRVIKYGTLLHADFHLTVPWYLNVNEAHEEIEKLRTLITSEFGDAFEMFVHTDGCMPPARCAICIKQDCPVRQHVLEKRLQWTLANVLLNENHTLESEQLNEAVRKEEDNSQQVAESK